MDRQAGSRGTRGRVSRRQRPPPGSGSLPALQDGPGRRRALCSPPHGPAPHRLPTREDPPDAAAWGGLNPQGPEKVASGQSGTTPRRLTVPPGAGTVAVALLCPDGWLSCLALGRRPSQLVPSAALTRGGAGGRSPLTVGPHPRSRRGSLAATPLARHPRRPQRPAAELR